MEVVATDIKDVFILVPRVFQDDRGFFLESWNKRQFSDALGESVHFVQDNHSHSSKGVLRGLHYQLKHPQGKLVRVLTGEILDVAVDLRVRSPTFGQHVAVPLTAKEFSQLWIPPGFAHGFFVRSNTVDVLYKTTEYYFPDDERSILYSDSDLNIDWLTDGSTPILSSKDKNGVFFKDADFYD